MMSYLSNENIINRQTMFWENVFQIPREAFALQIAAKFYARAYITVFMRHFFASYICTFEIIYSVQYIPYYFTCIKSKEHFFVFVRPYLDEPHNVIVNSATNATRKRVWSRFAENVANMRARKNF